MKKMGTISILTALLCAGCSSTEQRALGTAAATAVGGGAGYLLGNKKPAAIVGGAAGGALISAVAMGEDPKVKQAGFDDGYAQGQSDAIKRQYFLRQALETQPLPDKDQTGKTVEYVVPGPTVMYDGRKLDPHTVSISVTE